VPLAATDVANRCPDGTWVVPVGTVVVAGEVLDRGTAVVLGEVLDRGTVAVVGGKVVMV
jgi:hypothetical protein